MKQVVPRAAIKPNKVKEDLNQNTSSKAASSVANIALWKQPKAFKESPPVTELKFGDFYEKMMERDV